MSIPPGFETLVGKWSGTKKLWLSPTEPLHESAMQMIVASAARCKFLTLHYSWKYEDTPQEGFFTARI